MKTPYRNCLTGIMLALFCVPGAAREELELEGTTITGNSELPKALHIVPWKATLPDELVGRPMHSLVDEVLAPVDRDVFMRELDYYEVVHRINTTDQ